MSYGSSFVVITETDKKPLKKGKNVNFVSHCFLGTLNPCTDPDNPLFIA